MQNLGLGSAETRNTNDREGLLCGCATSAVGFPLAVNSTTIEQHLAHMTPTVCFSFTGPGTLSADPVVLPPTRRCFQHKRHSSDENEAVYSQNWNRSTRQSPVATFCSIKIHIFLLPGLTFLIKLSNLVLPGQSTLHKEQVTDWLENPNWNAKRVP